ncbi:maltase A1-like [Ostrinia furnacalis]|uniref:maltase A1-like n=1 Tax=Ostrinia furnacalis TaxID=93504 RepID=UPI00103F1A04|nr:maltase A1-like [Ostrinia furnacalis]
MRLITALLLYAAAAWAGPLDVRVESGPRDVRVESGARSAADWWQTALVYQIYPRSFKDSDGDGIGDLNGITEKLPYLKDTGVDAIWMSPIFLSPMYDFGYDITDYRQIAPEYGTMDDFDNLLATAKEIGIRIILDFVPNHTGNESEWFIKSKNREPGYENYYVWADGIPSPDKAGVMLPPSNWISIFRKSAWEWCEERQQFYLHQFVVGQPDLNYRDPRVQQEMKDVLSYWLDKGVSGFRVDAINMMYEVDPKDFDGKYPDEPLSGDPNANPEDYEYLSHPYTRDLLETYDVVYDWRDLLNEHTQKDGEYKILMTEAYTDIELMIRYYGHGNRNGSIPFNFSFLGDINNHSNARDIKMIIDRFMTYIPIGKTANWVNGNHDQSRLASRHGTNRVDAMNMLALLLPGVTITYQGEEIGMTDGYVSWEDTKDPQACNTDDPINYYKKSRDPNRTPYHWDDSNQAGFSTANQTWLPVADNYKTVNLASQMKASKSHYKFYKDVVAVKKSDAVRFGDLDTRAFSENILVVTRLAHLNPGIVGIVNLSDEDQVVDLSSIKMLPGHLLYVAASGVDCSLDKWQIVLKNQVTVSGHCAIVLRTLLFNC